MKMSLSTIYTIDLKNTSLLNSVLDTIQKIKDDNHQIIFKVFIGNNVPPVKNLNFRDESRLVNEEGIDFLATTSSSVFESLISKDHEVDATLNSGYMVFETEDKNYNEDYIGFDYLLTEANLEMFLNFCKATPANENEKVLWQGTDSENVDRKYGQRFSNRVFDVNYYYVKKNVKTAIEYLSEIIEDPSKIVLPSKSSIRSSKLYVVRGHDIQIKIDKKERVCGYPYTLQRLFFIYHSIKEWVKTISNRWIEIYPYDCTNTFTYSLKKESWMKEEEKRIPFFKKKFTMNETSVWSVFCVDDKITNKSRMNICVDFFKKYGINIRLEKFSGEIETDSATVVNYIIGQSSAKIFALPINQIRMPPSNNPETQKALVQSAIMRKEKEKELEEIKKQESKQKKKENKEARKNAYQYPPPTYEEFERTNGTVVISMPKPKSTNSRKIKT